MVPFKVLLIYLTSHIRTDTDVQFTHTQVYTGRVGETGWDREVYTAKQQTDEVETESSIHLHSWDVSSFRQIERYEVKICSKCCGVLLHS